MIARAIVIFFMVAFPLYLLIQMVLERRLSRERAASTLKKVGIAFISASLAGMALMFILLADKFL